MLGDLIADGRTSEVYRYGADGAAKLLKTSTPQHWAALEAQFTASVGRLGLPVPEVRDVIDIGGRAAIVYERIDGPSMWQHMIEHPADVETMVEQLVEVQRRILAAGVPDALPSLVDRLRVKLVIAPHLSAADRRAADRLLDSLPTGSALLHGDLHPANVLLGADGLVVIDWFDATVGHPQADIARTQLLLQPRGGTDRRHLPGADLALAERVHRAYVACTEAAFGPLPPEWLRLRAAGRLAERTDADVSGLLAIWRSGSADDDEVAE